MGWSHFRYEILSLTTADGYTVLCTGILITEKEFYGSDKPTRLYAIN